ncbi:hypothetical protein PUR71_15585 [Streptomyces sp. SP17BM10]|uniref:hypothetical protein n=1 Tax=Streptomyces sp. SP17BM10 TaxID=3002530 RepID=UPI002E766328|nr:hypothetical protein [Streptomyces sp. SP17BM10]MEE1784309.1 hypothetical protein [Streptomyces sp. SP17BM10]
MNNLDFSNLPLFSWYVVLLAVSGIAVVVLGAVNVGRLKGGWRILTILFGVGYVGYAYYLAFVFDGDKYRIFFQVFIPAVLLIADAVRRMANRGTTPAEAPQPTEPPAPVPAPMPYSPNAQPLQSSPAAPPAVPAPATPPGQPVADNPYAQPKRPPHAD